MSDGDASRVPAAHGDDDGAGDDGVAGELLRCEGSCTMDHAEHRRGGPLAAHAGGTRALHTYSHDAALSILI